MPKLTKSHPNINIPLTHFCSPSFSPYFIQKLKFFINKVYQLKIAIKMSSTSTDSHDSVIFVSEQKLIHVEVHPQSVHVPEAPAQNENQNTPLQQQEDPDCIIIIPETTGKLLKLNQMSIETIKSPKYT